MEAKVCNCLTGEEKKFILANHEESKSYSEIAGIVWWSKSIVYHVISRFKADKSLEPKPRTGRPLMTTKWEDRIIVKMSLKDRFNTATSISHAFCEQSDCLMSYLGHSLGIKDTMSREAEAGTEELWRTSVSRRLTSDVKPTARDL